jgi:hypothetical protein
MSEENKKVIIDDVNLEEDIEITGETLFGVSEEEPEEEVQEEEPPRKKRKYVRKDPNKKITRRRSPEHNQKIAEALRGRVLDAAHRDAIAQSMIGNQNRVKK